MPVGQRDMTDPAHAVPDRAMLFLERMADVSHGLPSEAGTRSACSRKEVRLARPCPYEQLNQPARHGEEMAHRNGEKAKVERGADCVADALLPGNAADQQA